MFYTFSSHRNTIVYGYFNYSVLNFTLLLWPIMVAVPFFPFFKACPSDVIILPLMGYLDWARGSYVKSLGFSQNFIAGHS